ncbi:MAG: hypothetical protein ACYCOX_05910, partial [Acidobacteriaceae bacterium]
IIMQTVNCPDGDVLVIRVPRSWSKPHMVTIGAVNKFFGRVNTRLDDGFRKQYQARCHHKPKGVAKVAAARKLVVRLYWMLRQNVGYPEIAHIESSPRVPLVGASQTEGLNGRSRIQP